MPLRGYPTGPRYADGSTLIFCLWQGKRKALEKVSRTRVEEAAVRAKWASAEAGTREAQQEQASHAVFAFNKNPT
jgi:hypothetical protein